MGQWGSRFRTKSCDRHHIVQNGACVEKELLSAVRTAFMYWWALGVIVYMLVGALLSGKIGQPSSIFDAILITLLWALFWPLIFLLRVSFEMIWPEERTDA